MKILISGANGQLGHAFAGLAGQTPHKLISLTRDQFDITDRQQILTHLAKFQPDVLINTAAYTAVDKAEQEVAAAFAVNAEAVRLLAECCASANVPLIHYSTDYVFSGEQQRAYKEDDVPAPVNQYGLSKLAGEEAIRAAWNKHLILRVCGLFSEYGTNFVKIILRLSQTREEINVVADQITCPTPAKTVAQTTLQIIEQLLTQDKAAWGTYHYCGQPPLSWYEFAEEIVILAAKIRPLQLQRLIPVTSIEYASVAKRPLYAVLDCNKLRKQFNIELEPWQLELRSLIRTLLA